VKADEAENAAGLAGLLASQANARGELYWARKNSTARCGVFGDPGVNCRARLRLLFGCEECLGDFPSVGFKDAAAIEPGVERAWGPSLRGALLQGCPGETGE